MAAPPTRFPWADPRSAATTEIIGRTALESGRRTTLGASCPSSDQVLDRSGAAPTGADRQRTGCVRVEHLSHVTVLSQQSPKSKRSRSHGEAWERVEDRRSGLVRAVAEIEVRVGVVTAVDGENVQVVVVTTNMAADVHSAT